MASNRIGDDGARALADVISGRCVLLALSLDDNHIHDDGVEHLACGMLKNNTIERLSLSANNIGERGARALAESLQLNNQVKILNLSRNPLGPVGAQHIGRILATNRSLTKVSLANCNVVANQVYIGLHTVMEAVRHNTKISQLDLAFNNIPEDTMVQVALAMRDNMYLVELRLEGNPIETKWLRPGYLRLRSIPRLPTIATSLAVHRQAAAARSTTLSELLQNKSRQERRHILSQIREGVPLPKLVEQYGSTLGEDDEVQTRFGEWTIRRTWMPKKNEVSMLEAHKRHKQEAQEQTDQEQLFIDRFATSKYRELEAMLSQDDGRRVLHAIRRVYCQVLETARRQNARSEPEEPNGAAFASAAEADKLPVSARPPDDKFVACVAIAFKLSGADDQFKLPSEHISELARWLCLQDEAWREMLQAVSSAKDGVQYLKLRPATRMLAKELQRVMSVEKLHELRGNTKEELLGRTSIAMWIRDQFFAQARAEFRQRCAPRYICRVCQSSFLSKRRMRKHHQNADRYHAQIAAEHRRAAAVDVLMSSAKVEACGCKLPACFETEVDPDLQLQVLDYFGSSGRPITTVHGYTCFYAEDSFGPWLKVTYGGLSGWIRRTDPSEHDTYLFPIGTKRRLPAELHVFPQPTFYRVTDGLSERVQLKVRAVPQLSCKPSAFLDRQDVVQAVAQCGEWLLVRYDHNAGCQWLLEESAGNTLVVAFTEEEQELLRAQNLSSPITFHDTLLEKPLVATTTLPAANTAAGDGDGIRECEGVGEEDGGGERDDANEAEQDERMLDDNASVDSTDWVNDI